MVGAFSFFCNEGIHRIHGRHMMEHGLTGAFIGCRPLDRPIECDLKLMECAQHLIPMSRREANFLSWLEPDVVTSLDQVQVV